MERLWQNKTQPLLDERVMRFTVGDDWRLDWRLIPADCLGSIAHARMLAKIGAITDDELNTLQNGLLYIVGEHEAGRFTIDASEEDGHTAIENRLIARCGEAGKKIHTGRSRNDQSLTAIRVYGRAAMLRAAKELFELTSRLLDLALEHERVFMVGRTHMQPAMPSTLGVWASSYAEQLLDDAVYFASALKLLDRSPLGSVAGFGAPLPLDREMTAALLGFTHIHHVVLAAANSRGRSELHCLLAFEQAGITISRLAQDILFFSLPEIGYMRLPANFCTGSSVMPQKRNPDLLELSRAKCAALSGYAKQTADITRGLPSGYNRDSQEAKGFFMRGCDSGYELLSIMRLVLSHIEIFPEAMRKAATPAIFATDLALEHAARGKPFRDAYRDVSSSLESVELGDLDAAIAKRSSTGSPGNLSCDALVDRLELESRMVDCEKRRIDEALYNLAGRKVDILPSASC